MEVGTLVKMIRPICKCERSLVGKYGRIESVANIKALEDKNVEYPKLIVSFFGMNYTTALYPYEVMGIIK